ncbi:MAG: FAD-dependent oxidoreductase [Actinomycetota bacterium]|nr:MAG: FAD-dependent oxidoreductase [Actinomycetota bacterium]
MNGDRRHPLGFWLETCGEELAPRPPLPGDLAADVAIVGGGFTGLWTAYHLAKAEPGLRVAIVERRVAGFGASGRNGGWASAELTVPPPALAARFGRDAAAAMQAALRETVLEIGRVCEAEGVDAHYVRGGSLKVATSSLEADRLRAELEAAAALGVDGRRWLEAEEAAARIGVRGLRGAVFTPDCATVHPARLARGLARVVEGLGVRIFEGTTARGLRPGRVRTDRGTVRADVVVRALEGETGSLRGHERLLLALHIHMGVTEPLPPSFFERVGWEGREALSDARPVFVYAQRTRDDRIALGLARGHPHPGWLTPHYVVPSAARALRATLARLFPEAAGVRIERLWSGYVGAPRDGLPSVGLRGGIAWAGGYFGDGVTASALAGRTLAELILGRSSERTELPWVGHRWRPWEPTPLALTGAGAVFAAMRWADAVERRTDRPSRLLGSIERLLFGLG